MELDLGEYVVPDLDMLVDELRRLGSRRVLIEAPPGLKQYCVKLCRALQSALGVDITLTTHSCWGFCDVNVYMLRAGYYDTIVHLGHYMPPCIEHVIRENLKQVSIKLQGDKIYISTEEGYVLGWPMYRKAYPELLRRLVELARESCPSSDTVIYTTQQYVLHARYLAEQLGLSYRLMTGCYAETAQEHVLVLAPGMFHAITFFLLGKTPEQVTVVDPEQQQVTTEKCWDRFNKLLRLKLGILLRDYSRSRAVVMLSRKIGQRRVKTALRLRSLLEQLFEEVVVLDIDDIEREKLLQVPAEIYVNTACPRVGFDDIDRLDLPIVNPGEVPFITREKSLEDYTPRLILQMS